MLITFSIMACGNCFHLCSHVRLPPEKYSHSLLQDSVLISTTAALQNAISTHDKCCGLCEACSIKLLLNSFSSLDVATGLIYSSGDVPGGLCWTDLVVAVMTR